MPDTNSYQLTDEHKCLLFSWAESASGSSGRRWQNPTRKRLARRQGAIAQTEAPNGLPEGGHPGRLFADHAGVVQVRRTRHFAAHLNQRA